MNKIPGFKKVSRIFKFQGQIVLLAIVGLFLLSFASAYASSPSLSAFYTGSGDSVQINVSGADPNYGVLLLNNSSLQSLGTTNSSGIFSITISTAQYNITPGSIVSVIVNNQTSNSIQWPYTSGSSSFSLSQTSLSISTGQSAIVTASNSGPFFVSSNSNSSVASVSINGNQITATGLTAGTTNVSICLTSNASNCLPLSVAVTGASAQSIYFSQNNLNISSGQTATVSVSGGTGSYSITGNSNSNSIQASLNGAVVTLYGSSSGSSAITICSPNTSYCGTINATVNSNALILTPSNSTLTLGQATTISIMGGLAPYYISSNSNNSVVQSSLSNNILTLSAVGSGSATISVCSANSICGSELVTVNSTGATATTFSQSNVTLSPSQSLTISIYGSGSYYISNNSNSSVASAVVSGSNLIITGSSSGTDNVTVCSGSGQCGTIIATVGSSSVGNSGLIYLTYNLSVGQSLNFTVSGGSAPYYLTSNSNSTFSASINNGNQLVILGLGVGSSSFNVCSSNGSCMVVYVNVSAAASPVSSNNTATSTVASATQVQNYVFSTLLNYGMSGAAVTELQQRLTSEGYYRGPITGYYGDLTTKAVKEFQLEHGISSVGYVGPSTRAVLNK